MTENVQIPPLQLYDLCQNKPARPGWSITFGATCAEAAAVCLEDQGHRDHVMLQNDGMQACEIEIRWMRSMTRFAALMLTKKLRPSMELMELLR